MKKHLKKIFSIVSILLLTIFSNNLFSQVYLLNEDFSSASGVKPPVGWNNITVTGAASDVWRYDNPGVRQVTFPIIGTFAIFDSENYSGPGGAEKVSLETPFVDCSFSPNIILYFDHVFKSNRAGKADVEIFDGANWVIVKSFLDSVPVAKTESIDVSSLIGNKTGAKVRFTWQGDSSQYWIVDNVKLYAPLSKDVRLKTLNSPVTPVLAGVNPISITLSNEGYQTVTSATIRWTANGVAQSSYNWTGNIVRDSAQANIPIGTYNFPASSVTKFKIWVDNPNGTADLNKLNDTLDANLYTALCGTYTIGGVNPSFATFSDAVTALNNAGVTCPVVFKVRDGVYEEQIRIYDVKGSSLINTVTFESESGDSSKVQLLYQAANGTSDFVISFNRSGHIRFNGIGIRRVNGYGSVHILEGAHHIGISDSWLTGNVYISTYGSDTAVSLRNNNIQGNNIDINRFGGDVLNGVYVEGNFFNSLSISNASNISVVSNRGGVDTAAYAFNINLSGVSNAKVEGNKSNLLRASSSNSVKFLRNRTPDNGDWGIVSGSSTNVEIRGNSLGNFHGILLESGDSIRVVGNRIFRSSPSSGHGILAQGAIRLFEADSNEVVNYGYGVTTRPPDGQLWKVTDNKVMQTNIVGILLEGVGGQVSGNRVLGVSSGSGINVSGQGLRIFNNYIQIGGDGNAKGLSLQPSGSSSSILFNSVNITGTDIVNGRALEVLGGDRYVIKNNIFANTGGGYAAYYNVPVSTFDLDYNNYYSSKSRLIYHNGSLFDTLSSFVVSVSKDINSFAVNPYYVSDTALQPSHILLDQSGIADPVVTFDILRAARNTIPDIGAKNFTLCSNDAGVDGFSGLSSSVNAGVSPIKITLVNHGTSVLTSAGIRWSVNGVAQPLFNWTGNLSSGQSAVVSIGSFNFSSGGVYKLRSWVSNVNGSVDCKPSNDTTSVVELGTALCGTYTIGGVNPSFATFSDAVTALNNAGVTCPVVFKVRDGVYEEQIRIYDVKGSSLINTVTFESESGDSSKVQLLYQAANGTSDFVISFNRSGHIRFNGIGIRRVNGYGSVHILEGAHHIGISDSWLTGNVYISTYGSDTAVSLRNNNIQGNNIDINRFGGDVLNGVYVEGNFFNSLSISNASNISVVSNRGGVDTAAYAFNINLSGVSNAKVEGNKSNLLRASSSNSVKFLRNRTPDNGDWGIVSGSSTNVEIRGNSLGNFHGILLESGDSIRVVGNRIFRSSPSSGHGILAQGAIRLFEADSNEVVNYGYGVTTRPPDGQLWKVTDNKVMQTNIVGILLEGVGGQVSGNRVLGVSSGSGINVSGQGLRIFNNYIQIGGDGNAKGLSLQPSGSSSSILFNSVNITGTDIVNGRALEVLGGDRYVIKNNIFANTGGGYAAYFVSTPGVKDIDYNNYFSTGNSFGYLGGQSLNNITSWGVALNSDANSKNLNPNYKADTALLPFQKQFNGAGISSGNILLDIDGEIRNQQAPDIGAQEFMVDFGVTRLVSPTNDCFQKDSTPVTIYLRQFGDIPFIDLKLAYQVNNGPVFKDTIPGAISNDLEYTFKRPQDMSTNGEYLFKIWLEENGDDNLNNDTLVVLRKNKNAPRVDFNYVTQCAGIGVPFTGTAAIDTGFIARIEWEFGDSTIGVGYTPSHIYDTSGTYIVTMRAFSDQGCFSEVKKAIVLKSTPITSFSVKDACFGTAVKPVNNSLIKAGGTISNYVWKWGDGQTSTGFEPTHQYAISDTFDITLITTASNGCVDSVTNKSITYSLENTAFKLNKPAQDFICEGSSLKLSASGASSYQWLFNKLPIDGAVDSVYQATKAGDYAVIFVNGLGCRSNATQPLKIKFNPIPEAKFNFDSYCVGASIQFRDSSKVDSLNRVSYSWNFGDGSPAQQVGNPVYTYTKEGEYKVSLIIKSTVCINQADTLERSIKVELPLRGKRYEPVTVLENKSKKLEAREFGVKYQWNPSTYLDNPNIAEPKYTAGKEQTYTIKITAKSGCITIDTLQVALYSKCDIRAPEGFSPNEDGKNDKFYPFQIGIKNMQVFRVYDRFGNLVYDDKNANSSNGWDGKHKGKKLPIGTYVWVAEGIGEDDVPVKRSGNVILIK